MPQKNPKSPNPKSPVPASASRLKKAPELQKRRARPDHNDDSSVDSEGNIRDLIDYDEDEDSYESESEFDTDDSSWRESDASSEKKGKGKGKKKAKAKSKSKEKAKAKKKIASPDTVDTMPSPPPKRRAAAIRAEKRIQEEIEMEKANKKEKEKEKAKEKAASVTSDEEDDDEDLDEDDDSDAESYYEAESESESDSDKKRDNQNNHRPSGIELLISDLGEAMRPQKPKKYKMSKEPENVRRFVKLVQTEVDPNEEDIDRDIGYFKGLSPKSQDRLLTKLRNKVEPAEPTVPLKFQILAKDVPGEVERVAMSKYHALQNIDPSSTEFYKAQQWIHGYTQLPLSVYKDLPVKIEDGTEACQTFVSSVQKHMETAIYGHDEAKLQILQFVSNWIANPQSAGNVLSIHGPPGVGKTTLVKDGVAKALGRPFHFITLGGATDASFLDGHSYTYEGSTWGRIVDVLIKSKCMNPVIYFDELDKVSDTPKGEEINNLLIHLTDQSQNDRFQDKYFTGIDLDLSRCLFIFSHNDHQRVNPILRDRMYNIQVDGFDLKQKLVIAEQYLVNQALREVNLFEKIGFSKEIISHIIETYTGEEKGVRELKRGIATVISKLNLLRFYNDPAKVPFAIEGFCLPFTLKKTHVDLFLKKKDKGTDPSIAHMYI